MLVAEDYWSIDWLVHQYIPIGTYFRSQFNMKIKVMLLIQRSDIPLSPTYRNTSAAIKIPRAAFIRNISYNWNIRPITCAEYAAKKYCVIAES